MLALGIDIGTSGVRTAVLESGELISEARTPHLTQDPANIDAEKWWGAVRQCLTIQAQALRRLGRDLSEISGIAVDGTSGTMVLTDTELRPTSPALMYNSKGFEAEAALIADHVSGPHITKGGNSALARAMRLNKLSRSEPSHLMHQADFIVAKLSGVGGRSDYNNALKTGFDAALEEWPDWIEHVFNPALLPIVHSPGKELDEVAPDIARDFGFLPQTTVHAGTTDSIAAFLASAPLKPRVAVTSLGSTIAVKYLSPIRVDAPEIGLYSHRLGDLWLAGGASNSGGAVLKAHFSDDQLQTLSQAIDPAQSTGLDFYPLLDAGERFPINDPDLAPRLEPRPEDDVAFLQAMLEGMARIETTCYRKIEALGAGYPETVYTAGGGSANSAWTEIRSRALGLEIAVPKHTEASIGAARLVTL